MRSLDESKMTLDEVREESMVPNSRIGNKWDLLLGLCFFFIRCHGDNGTARTELCEQHQMYRRLRDPEQACSLEI